MLIEWGGHSHSIYDVIPNILTSLNAYILFMDLLSAPLAYVVFSVALPYFTKFPWASEYNQVIKNGKLLCVHFFIFINKLVYVFYKSEGKLFKIFVFSSQNLSLVLLENVYYTKMCILVCIKNLCEDQYFSNYFCLFSLFMLKESFTYFCCKGFRIWFDILHVIRW